MEYFASKSNEFAKHLNLIHVKSVREITYKHLLSFVISGNPSVHTKKNTELSHYGSSFDTLRTAIVVIIIFFGINIFIIVIAGYNYERLKQKSGMNDKIQLCLISFALPDIIASIAVLLFIIIVLV